VHLHGTIEKGEMRWERKERVVMSVLLGDGCAGHYRGWCRQMRRRRRSNGQEGDDGGGGGG
jgi:hypothetical protein